MAVVRSTIGTTDKFWVKAGLHQGSALSPFLLAIVINRFTDQVRQEPPQTMMFADDIAICGESRLKRAWRNGDMDWKEEE